MTEPMRCKFCGKINAMRMNVKQHEHREIADMHARGQTDEQIADVLNIDINSIRRVLGLFKAKEAAPDIATLLPQGVAADIKKRYVGGVSIEKIIEHHATANRVKLTPKQIMKVVVGIVPDPAKPFAAFSRTKAVRNG